jgi:hypothetical protein
MDEQVLIASCTSGLANRLLMISGAERLARLTQRKLLVYWPENDQLGCSFDALFKNTFSMLRDSDMHQLLRSDRPMKVYNARKCAPFYQEFSSDGDPSAEIVLVKGWTAPKFAHETLAEITDELCANLKQLLPQDELLATVSSVVLPKQCVGVHVRHGETWKYVERSVQSMREHFETILRALTVACPNAAFVLATTQPAIEENFRALFGDRIILSPKSSRERDGAGIREALIDLLLLSRTQAVLGTFGSTFSQVAAMLGPKILAVANQPTATIQLPMITRCFVDALNGVPQPNLKL